MHFTATWHAMQIMAAVTAAAAAASAGSLAQSSCNIRVSIPLLPRTCANVLYSAKNLIRRNQVKPIILTFSRNLRTSTDFRYPNHSLFRPCHALAADAAYFSVAAESLYDFSVNDIDGKEVPLNKYKGKVVLVVNVASKCGLTPSNYTELSHLYEKYKAQGFEILAFPCNQFGGQEPGKNSEIKEFACTRYKAEFPIFDKIDVNGTNTAPVYNYLKSSKGGGLLGDNIKWNFEKFLIDKNGKVVERYLPVTSPFQIEKDIQKLLAA